MENIKGHPKRNEYLIFLPSSRIKLVANSPDGNIFASIGEIYVIVPDIDWRLRYPQMPK